LRRLKFRETVNDMQRNATNHEHLIKALVKRIARLATIDVPSLDAISPAPSQLLSGITSKQLAKTLLNLSRDFRTRSRFANLRATISLGTYMLGEPFLKTVERSGLLLSDRMPSREFGRFLYTFRGCLSGTRDHCFLALSTRLDTYISYYNFEKRVRHLRTELMLALRQRPRIIIKEVLALTSLGFLRDRMLLRFDGAHNRILDAFRSPEDLAGVASLMIAVANLVSKLDVADFSHPLKEEFPSPETLRTIDIANQENQRLEVAQLVSLFGYELVEHPSNRGLILTLRPPSRDFGYVNTLGYIRTQLGSFHRLPPHGATELGSRVASLRALAKQMVLDIPQIADVVDVGTASQRIRLHLPVFKELYEKIASSWFLEDVTSFERLGQEFLSPIPIYSAEEMYLTKNLTVKRFLSLWRILLFWMLIDISVLEKVVPSQPALLINSLVRIIPDHQLIQLLQDLDFTVEETADALRLISGEVNALGFYDLQYRPFLHVASTLFQKQTALKANTPRGFVYLAGVVAMSNIFRNVQSANAIRFESNAAAFVKVVADLFGRRFPKVTSNRRLEKDSTVTDVDVVLFEGATLYLFECKYSVPPASPHEQRDVWEDIERASRQLSSAIDILENPKARQSYLAGWFPGTKSHETTSLSIRACILCSDRTFSGLSFQGFPVRDFSSLSLLFGDGIISMGSINQEQKVIKKSFRLYSEGGPSITDLNDYLSSNPKYLEIYAPFMRPITRLEYFNDGQITLGLDAFVLAADDIDEWISHVESISVATLPDEELTIEQLQAGHLA
jgi:hypothetical protein